MGTSKYKSKLKHENLESLKALFTYHMNKTKRKRTPANSYLHAKDMKEVFGYFTTNTWSKLINRTDGVKDKSSFLLLLCNQEEEFSFKIFRATEDDFGSHPFLFLDW